MMLIKDRGVDVSTFRRVDVKCKCASEVRRTADLCVEVYALECSNVERGIPLENPSNQM